MIHKIPKEKLEEFTIELATLINYYSFEQYCNTPDFIIARHLVNSFEAYCDTMDSMKIFEGFGNENEDEFL